jgi:hypothetical protein
MQQDDRLEQAIRDLQNTNRALTEQVRAFCQAVEDGNREQDRRRKRFALFFVVLFYSVPTVVLIGGRLFLRPDNDEQPWQKQDRQRQEQLDRAERALSRAEKLLDRREKAPPEK